jgi:hypothetical protein
MPEIDETFSTYEARIEKAVANVDKPIILSTEVKIATLTDIGDIKKIPVAWPLYTNGHKMFYITTVPKGTRVPRHSHEEDVFRLVIKGSLVLNRSIHVKEGMWFVIRGNTLYEIDTETGYITLSGYRFLCETPGPGGKHWIDE